MAGCVGVSSQACRSELLVALIGRGKKGNWHYHPAAHQWSSKRFGTTFVCRSQGHEQHPVPSDGLPDGNLVPGEGDVEPNDVLHTHVLLVVQGVRFTQHLDSGVGPSWPS